MANPKEYAYYVVGNQVGVVEKDVNFDNDPNSKDYGPGVEKNAWKSPLSSVTDGLKLEYTYAPTYNIHRNQNTGNLGGLWHVNGWFVLDGYVAFVRSIPVGVSTWNTNSATSGTQGDTGGQSLDYIVVTGSSTWNGLHRIQTAGGAYGTLLGGILKTYTKADTIGPYYTAVDFDLAAASETVFDGGGNDTAIHIADAGWEVGDYVWMSGHTSAAINNGVFTISAINYSATAASSNLVFDTRYHMPSKNTATPETEISAAADFTDDTDGASDLITIAKIEHEVCKIYTDVSVLNDEDDTIDIPSYLSKALVYYVKAKMAEDGRDVEGKEYFMREFRRMVEKHQSSLIKTGRFISSGAHAIR